jgi:hypothetical protein
MDPLDHLRALPDGVRCTVCGERVPASRIRLLAWRDDLAFLEIDCGACLSTTLAFAMGAEGPDEDPISGPPPITSDDLLDMHQFLATWSGDLSGLLSERRDRAHRSDERGRAGSSR